MCGQVVDVVVIVAARKVFPSSRSHRHPTPTLSWHDVEHVYAFRRFFCFLLASSFLTSFVEKKDGPTRTNSFHVQSVTSAHTRSNGPERSIGWQEKN